MPTGEEDGGTILILLPGGLRGGSEAKSASSRSSQVSLLGAAQWKNIMVKEKDLVHPGIRGHGTDGRPGGGGGES